MMKNVSSVVFYPNNLGDVSSQFKRKRHHVDWNLMNPNFQNIFSEINVVKSQMLHVSLQTNHTTRQRLDPLSSISPQSPHQNLHLTFHINACVWDIILKYGSASR